MSVPVLYEANATDFFNKGLGTLPDALTAVVTEERNGEFIFEMTYPIDGARADLLENNRIIKVDAGHVLTDQRFVIKKTTPQMSEDGKICIDVYAEHISYITNDLALKPSVTVSGSANDAMQQWQKAIVDDNDITADSDITTSNSTAWTIDKVQTARQALGGVDGSVLDVWGGEYLFDNLHISLKKQRGSYANTLLAYGRNITSFQQEENIESTYTSIYPYATLSSANGDTSSLYSLDEYFVDSQYVDNYPNRKILPVDFSSYFDNVKVGTKPSDASSDDTTVYMTEAEVKAQLKALAQQYITNNDVGIPTVSISVSFVDLSKTSNYADVAPLEQLDLCDIVPVRFTKLGIDTTAKVTHAEWNVLTDSYDKIELGSITPTLGQTLNTLTTVAQAAKQAAQDAQNNATIAWQSADGKTTTFQGSSSDDFPAAQNIGDQYYRENGDDTELYIWDGAEWKFIVSNKTGQNISNAIDTAMSEADTATTNANNAVDTANSALTKAQTGIDTANSAADNASTAMSNSNTAINNAKSAMTDAANAINTANNSSDIANAVQQQITTLKDGSTMTIAELESGLALKITKDDMNTALQPYATTSWTTNQISVSADSLTEQITKVKNTADSNTSSVTKLQTDVSGLSTTVGQVQDMANSNFTKVTTLEQRADGFDTSISNLSTNKADQSWTTNQIKASADSLNMTITSVQTQVNNSAVGTNLLLNSGNGWVGDPSQSPRLPDSDIEVRGTIVTNSDRIMKITSPSSGEFFYRFANPLANPSTSNTLYGLTAGQTYTISGLANLTNGQLNFRAQTVNGSGGWKDFTGSQSGDLGVTNSDGTTFTKFSYTFTIPSVATGIYISLQAYNFTSGTSVLSFKQVKLELGTHATDYSANPADNATVTSVTTLSATVDKLSTTVSGKVDNTIYTSKITELANSIATKVSQTDYNSEITQLSTAIDAKVSTSDYNTEVTLLSNQIDSKVSSNTFNSQIQQLSNNINLRVVKNDVINQINVSNESILIAGNKVHITGSTTIDNAVIKSAMIDSLSASKLTAGTIDASLINVINLNANNITSGTLNGVTFHQKSSDMETWVDNNGIHNVSNSSNVWIKNGNISAYNSSGQGMFMDSGALYLTTYNLWENNGKGGTPQYGSVNINSDLFSSGGIAINGNNGYAIRTQNSDISSLSTNPWTSNRPNGSFIGGTQDGTTMMVGHGTSFISGGTRYGEGTYGLPCMAFLSVGSRKDKYGAINGGDGADVWMEGYQINIQSNNQDISLSAQGNVNITRGGFIATAGGSHIRNTQIDNELWVNGKLNVSGAKNAIVKTSKGWTQINAYETTEYYFGDIAKVNTGSGSKIKVMMDSLFLETVNTNVDYHVFVSSYGAGYAWVSEQTDTYFVIESNVPNLEVSYEVKAKRLGYENTRLEIDKDFEQKFDIAS